MSIPLTLEYTPVIVSVDESGPTSKGWIEAVDRSTLLLQSQRLYSNTHRKTYVIQDEDDIANSDSFSAPRLQNGDDLMQDLDKH